MQPSRPRALFAYGRWFFWIVIAALVLAGTATAARKITGRDVADSSLTGRDVRNSSLTGHDVRDSSLTGSDIQDRSLSPRDFSESVRGPAGADGAQGPPGPAGPRGPAGADAFTALSQHIGPDTPIPPGAAVHVSAACDPGEIAVSGGYTPTTPDLMLVLSSLAGVPPEVGDDGWTVLVLNTSDTNTGSFQVVAYCAPLPAAAAPALARSRSTVVAHRRELRKLARIAVATRHARRAARR